MSSENGPRSAISVLSRSPGSKNSNPLKVNFTSPSDEIGDESTPMIHSRPSSKSSLLVRNIFTSLLPKTRLDTSFSEDGYSESHV